MEQKKLKKIILSEVASIVMIALILAVVIGKNVYAGKRLQKSINLGNEYLNNLEYEQAIACYADVLKIDPSNQDALVNISCAYYGVASESDFEEAQENYTTALEYAKNACDYISEDISAQKILLQTYMALGNLYAENNDYELSLMYYTEALSMPTDDSLTDFLLQIEKQKDKAEMLMAEYERKLEMEKLFAPVAAMIEEIAQFCMGGDIDAVFEIMHTDIYQNFLTRTEELEEEEHYILDTNYGKVGIYKVDSEIFGNYMIYYGDYNGDDRHGEGMWIGYYDGNNYCAQGTWKEDSPNGEMQVREWFDGLAESVSYRVIIGTVREGLWDGDVIWRFEEEDETISYQVAFANGYWVVLRYDEEGEAIVSEEPIDGSVEKNGYMFVDNENVKVGIVGFGEG